MEKLNEYYKEVLQQAACVKGNVLASEAKKLEILDHLERKTKSTLEQIEIRRDEKEKEFQLRESDIEKTETLIKRWTGAEIMQSNDILDKIFNDENNHDDTADCERQSFARLCFVKNQKLFDFVSVEQIGSLNLTLTRAQQYQVLMEKESMKRLLDLKHSLFIL